MSEGIIREGQAVYVALPAGTKDYGDIGRMLVETLADLGCYTGLVRDGDPEALKADALIMFGSCAGFVRYPRLLAGTQRRPVTALWHVEPLPPVGLTARAERIGMMLSMCNWNKLPEPCLTAVRCLPFHNSLRDAARWILARGIKKELAEATGPREYGDIHHRQLYHAMDHYAWFKRVYSRNWCDFVFVSTVARCEFLNSRDIPCGYLPLGYHRGWGDNLGTERDIDVLFIGQVKRTRRRNLVKTIRRELESRGIRLVTVEEGCFGEQRTRVLNRAKIVLDIVMTPWEMPVTRLLMGMGCGALVVSTWMGDPCPFGKEHFVQTDTGDLADAVVYYLEHDEERQEIVDAAHRFVTEELTLSKAVSQILEVFNSRRNSRIEKFVRA